MVQRDGVPYCEDISGRKSAELRLTFVNTKTFLVFRPGSERANQIIASVLLRHGRPERLHDGAAQVKPERFLPAQSGALETVL